MRCDAIKLLPEKRQNTPIKARLSSLLTHKQIKMPPKQVSQKKQGNNLKLKDKQSVQTIMCANVSYVQKLCLSSTSWCLFDSRKGKHVGFRQKNQRQIASITKIMTTILAIQFIVNYEIPKDLLIKVTQSSAKLNGTTAQLKENTWVRLWDLLYGAMLPSGNDAANLLSEVVGYYRKNPLELALFQQSGKHLDLTKENTNMFTVEFIKMMNKKAQFLSLNQTIFSNPHGLQNAMNISTPKDIIRLSMYVAQNPHFKKIMNSDSFKYEYLQQISSTEKSTIKEKLYYAKRIKGRWWNTNQLLKKGWEGLKTGQTTAAGACLASLKDQIYIVVLNCKNNEARFAETQKIYDWYMENEKKLSTDASEGEDSV